MKNIILMFLLLGILVGFSLGQDEETRQGTGLPMKIGENLSNTNKGNISGKISLRNYDSSQPKPLIFVLVLYNGVMIERRQATENGSYYIQGIPRENVTITIEVNGVEVGRQNILPSQIGSMRQDFEVNMTMAASNNNSKGVVSANDIYTRSPANEKLYQKAISILETYKSYDSIKFLKQIVENDPKDFEAWAELGIAYAKNEKKDEAEIAYKKSLELKPDFLLTLLNLGRFYLLNKDSENAISVLTRAVEAVPLNADAQHFLGEAFLQAKKGSKAIGYLNEAIRLAPIEKAEIHLRLASLYNAAGLKDKAVEEYKQFLQKVPKYSDKEKLEKYIVENSPK
jgi:tetratricopeptide (TPR) repeat protein